jgi:NADP-dependent alcohol dehydrogenase
VLYSLPSFQVANGIADTYVHVIEQYLCKTGESPLIDRWAEGILQTLIEIAPEILKLQESSIEEKNQNPKYYDLMSSYMLSATLALNDFIRLGITEDWTTHNIGHELTALEGVTHGESLTIVLPALMKVMQEDKKDKIRQYGKRVFNVDGVEESIQKTKAFFDSLGLATSLKQKNIGIDTIAEIVYRFKQRATIMGENKNIDYKVVAKILEEAFV